MNELRRQFGVIGRAPSYRLLFFAAVGSTLGTLLAAVALVVDVKDRTDSGLWVSALFIVEFLPAVAVGLLFGIVPAWRAARQDPVVCLRYE